MLAEFNNNIKQYKKTVQSLIWFEYDKYHNYENYFYDLVKSSALTYAICVGSFYFYSTNLSCISLDKRL